MSQFAEGGARLFPYLPTTCIIRDDNQHTPYHQPRGNKGSAGGRLKNSRGLNYLFGPGRNITDKKAAGVGIRRYRLQQTVGAILRGQTQENVILPSKGLVIPPASASGQAEISLNGPSPSRGFQVHKANAPQRCHRPENRRDLHAQHSRTDT